MSIGKLILTEGGLAASLEEAEDMLRNAIESGAALEKLSQMVGAQDGNAQDVYDTSRLPDAKVKLDVPAPRAGFVSRIEAESVGLVAMHLGGGRVTKESDIDLSVGVMLNKKLGDRVEQGESLATIHASSQTSARQQAEALLACFELSDEKPERPAFIKAIVR